MSKSLPNGILPSYSYTYTYTAGRYLIFGVKQLRLDEAANEWWSWQPVVSEPMKEAIWPAEAFSEPAMARLRTCCYAWFW
jgi:hypothetical protein